MPQVYSINFSPHRISKRMIILLTFISGSCAQELELARSHINNALSLEHKSINKFVGKVFDRAWKVASMHHTNIDDTVLMKPAPVDLTRSLIHSPLPSVPGQSFQPTGRWHSSTPNKPVMRFDASHGPLHKTMARGASEAGSYVIPGPGSGSETPQGSSGAGSYVIPGPGSGPGSVTPLPQATVGHVRKQEMWATAMQDGMQEPLLQNVHSEEELDKFLGQYSELVVLKVVGPGCRACRAFLPKYKRIANQYKHVRFLWVLGSENQSTLHLVKKRLKVKATPSFFYFRDGELLADVRGAREEKFMSTLNDCTLPGERP